MGYLEMTNRYITISERIGHLEGQQRSGDTDLSVAQEIINLRKEQRELKDKIDTYNMKYNAEAWRCD